MSNPGRDVVIAIPVIKAGGELYLSPHFGRAPYYAIVRLESSGEYSILDILENPHVKHERGRGAKVMSMLISRGVSVVIALGMGYGALQRLRENAIKVYYVPSKPGELISLKRAIELYVNNQLEEAVEPRELG